MFSVYAVSVHFATSASHNYAGTVNVCTLLHQHHITMQVQWTV